MSKVRYQGTLKVILCTGALIATSPSIAEQQKNYDVDEAINHISIKHQSITDKLKEQKSSLQYNLVGIGLFSGKDPISYGIKGLTRSKVSHVGIILSDAQDENKWYCFESTGSAKEVLRGQYPHVRITPWKDVVKNYDGGISYRLFDFENDKRISPTLVTEFVEEYNGKSYTKSPLRLLKALLHKNRKSRSSSLKSVFCSELSSKMLMNLGVLEDGIPGNMLPRDFSSKKKIFFTSKTTLTPEFKEK